MLKHTFCFLVIFLLTSTQGSIAIAAQTVEDTFSARNKTQLVLDIEAALARAQAKLGIIPNWAAVEISKKASADLVSEQALKEEYAVVRHRMVALLNVWQRALDNGAEQYIHFGATTVDIYDTTLVLQLKSSIERFIVMLRQNEQVMVDLAATHAATPMIGRTLGQHALPITFGKKVSSWLGENRRNINRLKDLLVAVERSAILKGAVGSYLGLGTKGIELEREFSTELGLSAQPYLDDWHGARDIFAEYSLTLALISRSYGRVGNELFLLQMTDIGETEEIRRRTAVGSSTMPHKKNPSKSEALIHFSRVIPRQSEVVLDDMINYFERDNTSRVNKVIAEQSITTEKMLKSAYGLLTNVKVKPQVMINNLNKTNGLIMAQRLVFVLAKSLGKTQANDEVHKLAELSLSKNKSLKSIFEQSKYSHLISPSELDEVFNVNSYLGLAQTQTLAVIENIDNQRNKEMATLNFLKE
jgi:adenylosuccinate lyase